MTHAFDGFLPARDPDRPLEAEALCGAVDVCKSPKKHRFLKHDDPRVDCPVCVHVTKTFDLERQLEGDDR